METKIFLVPLILVLLYMSNFGMANTVVSERFYPTSCKDLNEAQLKSDIIQIQVDVNKEPFYVKCNHKLEGNGWTVVLNRYDGNRDFNCSWNDCVEGFGNLNKEFFIGLKYLHDITSSTLHELMFVMEDFDNVTKTARYDAFAVDGESNSFMIRVLGKFTGDAGDSFTHHAGHKFLTKEKDPLNKCRYFRNSPGWFNACSASNIFGKYAKGKYEVEDGFHFWGMHWNGFHGASYSLKKLTMLVRPVTA